jgi:hypothetical protein
MRRDIVEITSPQGQYRRSRKPTWLAVGALVAVIAVVGLALFQPWKLFTDVEVNETSPLAAAGATKASGSFTSLAHPTSGTAKIGTAADGAPVVFLENLDTDNGPDLKVYLSPVEPNRGNLVAGGLKLGDLKGNRGNQSYAVPAGTDLGQYKSVVIWCERFSVAFGVAPLGNAA